VPVIRIPVERLVRLTGVDIRGLQEKLFRLKCETELLDDGSLEIEVNPDRPDMLIGEGIARAVKGLTGVETGYKRLTLGASGLVLQVDPPPARPYIAVALVRNVGIDDEYLVELIQFQEKLHATFGRRRRKAAIGLHDAGKLPSETLYYRADPVGEVYFQPLGGDKRVSAAEVLSATEQGGRYGGISLQGGLHPFLYSGDEVIAMPPVINSEITRIEPGTRDVFIDVTGTDWDTVSGMLDVIVSNLAERPGAVVEAVEIVSVDGRRLRTPRLREDALILESSYVNRVLGSRLSPGDIAKALESMRFSTIPVEEGKIEVTIPPYRLDVLGPIDLVEDVAIGIGYDRLGASTGWPLMRGRLLDETRLARRLAEMMVGLGFIEVAQLTLTGPTGLSGFKEWFSDGIVEVENPVAFEYSILRPSLLVSLLQVAQANVGAQKPVKVFEIGYTVTADGDRILEEQRLAFMIMDFKSGYEDVQAVLYAVLERLGAVPGAREYEVPPLIPGRTAVITANNVDIGVIGEVKPEVLVVRSIEYPVAVGEISIPKLLEVLKGGS